jgi:hypothetical protein
MGIDLFDRLFMLPNDLWDFAEVIKNRLASSHAGKPVEWTNNRDQPWWL